MSYRKLISDAFEAHYSTLILYAIKWVEDEDIAKDIVQSIFTKLLEEDKKTKILDFKPYLFQSVRNRCINHLKKSKKSDQLEEKQIQSYGYFNDPIEEAEFESYVFKLIEELPPATKNIFKLNRFEGLTNQEIADKLNLSKRTVELQISNALKFLRTKIFDQEHSGSNFTHFISLLL